MIQNFRVSLCVLLAVVTGLGGCGGSGSITVSKNFDVPAPPAKIPMTVALRLQDDYAHKVFLPVANAAPVHMGDALRTGTEMVCRNIFSRVVVTEPGSAVPQAVDVVLTPSCELVKYDVVERATARVRTIIRWRLTAPDGRMIYHTGITGEAVRKLSTTVQASTMEREQGELYFLSMQDGFRKAQEQLLASTWWQNPWWK